MSGSSVFSPSRRARAYRRALDEYTRADPALIEQLGARAALAAFRRAARDIPLYRDLLKRQGINPRHVRSIGDFSRLPVVDKSLFAAGDLRPLLKHGDSSRLSSLLTSSGYTGKFSFGFGAFGDAEETADAFDAVFDYHFSVFSKRTLIINCLPMGVRVPTRACVLADVSVREDMALALVEKAGSLVEQIIVLGDSFFLKRVLDEGMVRGIAWQRRNVHVITGEDSFPESYRTYAASFLGIRIDDPKETRLIASSFGIGELGLNLFNETAETIRIRRFAALDEKFRACLFGGARRTLPMLFQYSPTATYIELTPSGEFLFTLGGKGRLSEYVRYKTGDRGGIIPYRELARMLKSFGKEVLLPRLKLPLVWVESRHSLSREITELVDTIREALFFDAGVARRVTGFFKIRSEDAPYQVDLQLERGFSSAEDVAAVRAALRIPRVEITPIPYFQMKDALTLDYNRKFHHT